ncbi:MAG: aspartate kinase, partial [Rhodobacteraceae bacterium]|nr:aspartate kinase [Paracoccaceae bacterium]
MAAALHSPDVKGPRRFPTVLTAGFRFYFLSAGLFAVFSMLAWTLWLASQAAGGDVATVPMSMAPHLWHAHEMLYGYTVAVMAGFQGIGSDNRITTLGRGGSDTSAVALAAAIDADRCDIYTDVDGIYTSDPRIVTRARKLDRITYEEMLEMASLGAKVLQTRSVELAMNHRVRLQVLSSFEDAPGTLVVDEEEIVEQEIVSGIAHSGNEAKITLVRVPDHPGIAAAIFGPLSEASINVDMIVQNVSEDGNATDLTFTVPKDDLARTMEVLEAAKQELGFERVIGDPDVVKISVVGVGMRSHAGVAMRMFQA